MSENVIAPEPVAQELPSWWGQSTRPVVTIASIFPQECRFTMRVGPQGGFTTYVLPAAPRQGEPTTLQVRDTAELLMRWEIRELGIAPIPAISIANDLVSQWTQHMLGSKHGRPGIWICAGSEPSVAEIAENRRIQEQFFRGLIQEGTDLAVKGQLKNITDLHRRAAEWLLGDGANSLTWFPRTRYEDLKQCPACGEEIKAAALTCKHCQTYLPEFYIKTGYPGEDPAVLAVIKSKKHSTT